MQSNVGAVVYKEVFVRNVSKDENLEEKNPPVASKVTARRAEGEKPMATKLPRRIIKTTPNKDASCPSLYKIPEEITLTRKFQFVGQSEVVHRETEERGKNFRVSVENRIPGKNKLKKRRL